MIPFCWTVFLRLPRVQPLFYDDFVPPARPALEHAGAEHEALPGSSTTYELGATSGTQLMPPGRSHPALAKDMAQVLELVRNIVTVALGTAVEDSAPLVQAGLDSIGVPGCLTCKFL